MRVTDLESEFSSVKLEIVTLKPESDAYLTLRNRFFATFRRGSLQSVLEIGRATVSAGNNTAHGVDFLTDARLFEKKTSGTTMTFLGYYTNRAASYQDHQEVVSALNLGRAGPGHTTDPACSCGHIAHFLGKRIGKGGNRCLNSLIQGIG